MIVGYSNLSKIQFPDQAGDLQRQGASASLVRELGDNYGRYHGWLASEAAKLKGPPDPKDYTSFDAYCDDWARAQNLVLAEVLLRNCRGFRKNGEALDKPHDGKVALYDERYRFVSVETGKPTSAE